jgi:hypothetical protein
MFIGESHDAFGGGGVGLPLTTSFFSFVGLIAHFTFTITTMN